MSADASTDPLSMSAEQVQAILAGPPEKAAQLLLAAASAGLPEAQALYGQVLLDGRGVEKDAAAGFQWFRCAARTGHPMATNMMGRCYEKGWGVDVDKVAAAQCYKQAAEAGLDWGMYNYASALGLGSGVAKDETAALGWFRIAAELGHAKSINILGSFYEEGRLVRADMERAAECYRRAAAGGDFRGQFNLARLLAEAGEVDEALAWLTKANETSTPEFRGRMKAYLEASSLAALREAGATL